VRKPDIRGRLNTQLSAPQTVLPGAKLVYTLQVSNDANLALNGVQAHFILPKTVQYVGSTGGGDVTTDGSDVYITLGRLAPGDSRKVQVTVQAPASQSEHQGSGDEESDNGELRARAEVRSATAMPADAGSVNTTVRE
jgi:uncharacterized repeat protein (TIGR01451 family)